ncbi:D-alanyl-D-alanine carboxypeptidase family protein [Variibacter gotjawalensis]|nr:D-alanyl-D-alanine carboxypeptidase family protein [Variibacter gotjawalensis]NIK47937.1 D-alanyl-D-alanine carboxypeptidase [Variibacter gotjawalensis]
MPSADAAALLLIDADSGKVLHSENAGYPWYPASVSKIMTTYVTLRAVKEGRIQLTSIVTVSPRALSQAPSKMGFPVGTQMTVEDALKMLMVKSANDIAVVLAEGVGGSVEGFAEEMNKTSRRLGMTQSSWVNPNGLPADGQITSARDMAILARTIMREFPEYSRFWNTHSIQLGRRVFRNYNRLVTQYPGADGMKTGFICASGYNLVATATRNGRKLIAVVLGANSGKDRTAQAAKLLDRGFTGGGIAWLVPSSGTVDSLQAIAAAPPNLRDEICGKNRGNRGEADDEPQPGFTDSGGGPGGLNLGGLITGFQPTVAGSSLHAPIDTQAPVVVSVIPPKGVANIEAAMAPRGRKAKKTKGGQQTVAIPVGENAKKKNAAAKPDAKPKAETKPKPGAKPAAGAKSANAAPAKKKPQP